MISMVSAVLSVRGVFSVILMVHLMMLLPGRHRDDLEHAGMHVVEKVAMKGPIAHIFRCDIH